MGRRSPCPVSSIWQQLRSLFDEWQELTRPDNTVANNFWGKEDAGVGPLLERMHNAKQTCDELRSFYTGMFHASMHQAMGIATLTYLVQHSTSIHRGRILTQTTLAMSQVAGVAGDGDVEDVARHGPRRGRVNGEATSEHCCANEERAGGAACCLCRRHERATKDYPIHSREAVEDQGHTDAACQQGQFPVAP